MVASPASVTASSVGQTAFRFNVVFDDNVALNPASVVAAGGLLVTGPNGYSAVPTVLAVGAYTTAADGSQQVTAVFSLTPPAGAWTANAGQDGTYTVGVQAGAVTDAAGNAATARAVGSFAVDLTPPTVTVSAPALSAPAVPVPIVVKYTFAVTYADPTGLNYDSVSAAQVVVTGPTGTAQTAKLAGFVVNAGSPSVTATYTITAQAGPGVASSAGTYAVSLSAAARSVQDGVGNTVATGTTLGTFSVKTS